MGKIGALVHKSGDERGAAAIAAFQAVRCDIGIPSRVIRLSTAPQCQFPTYFVGCRPTARSVRRPACTMRVTSSVSTTSPVQ
jgi:hypothetical protein